MNILNNIALRIHKAAVAKGFWDIPGAETKHIVKMHSELSEAVQADRAGIMYELETEDSKPEGVAAELADFVMMLLDWAVYNRFSVPDDNECSCDAGQDYIEDMTLPELVMMLHEGIVYAHNRCLIAPGTQIGVMVHMVNIWLEHHGHSLANIIDAKIKYNASRPRLHGRNY